MKVKNQGVVVVLVACIVLVQCQIVGVPGSTQTQFYLDRYSDCNGQPREVGQSTTMILGVSTEPQGQPVTSCTITLNTENVREPYKFRLNILSARIDNPGTYFYIYDGQYNGRILWTFSKNQPKPTDLQFVFTTGQMVTFKMSRGELERNYDIRVVAEPVRSEAAQCNYASEYGCDEYGYKYRILGTKEIAGIVAGCFALIILIVIIIIICCYKRQRGVSRKWKEEKLGHVNTAASIHSLNGKVNSTKGAPSSVRGPGSTRAWTTDSSRNGFASIRRSPNLPRAKIARANRSMGSDYSGSDYSDATLPKRPLPPPHVSSNPRGPSERSARRYREKYSDDDRSDRSSYDDRSFSTATKNFSERNYKPPTYREAMRHDSESSADEHTFVGANDSAQQRVLVEKEIVPRQKTSPEVKRAQRALPPPDQDLEYDSIEPKKFDRVKLVDKGIGSEEESEESDTENESEEESETSSEESEEEEEKDNKKTDKVDAVYSKPRKRTDDDDVEKAGADKPKEIQAVGFRPPQSSNAQQFARPPYLPPGVHQPQARYGYPGQVQYPPPMQGQYPPGMPPPYPQGYPQGQFPQGQIPQGQVPQGQPNFQPPRQANPSQPNAYLQSNFTVPLNQQQGPPMMQQYPAQPQAQRNRVPSQNQAPAQGQPNPNNIPVYSYLVNRGYKPVDGRYSPVSNSTGASNLSGDRNTSNDDLDVSANLASGVELMKRKN